MTPRHVLLPLPERAAAEPLARAWLAAQWQVDAETLPLARDARGRPRLHGALLHHDVSWSHSGGHLLIACGHDIHVGCDLERIRPRPNARALARRFFHPGESAWLDTLDDAEAEATFLRLWCAKEALLKAHGHGLSFGMHRLRFAETGDGLQLVDCDAALGRAEQWRLHEWRPLEDCLAAIAWHELSRRDGDAAIIAP